jgi:predicted PurR-regulated permease PerM
MADSVVRRVTWRTADLAKVLLLGLLFMFIWRFFWMVYPAIFISLLAILLAIVLHAPAHFLSRWMPVQLAFALVIAAFVGSGIALMLAMIPQILDQVTQLAAAMPNALNVAGDWLSARTNVPRDDELVQQINAQLTAFLGRFIPIAFNLITTVVGSFTILILAIFLAFQPHVYRGLIIRITPPASRAEVARVYDEAGRSLRLWVLGKAATMAFVGIATWIGLLLFDIPGALALAALAAVLEFVPNLGPTIAAIPAVIAAFLISPATALWVALFYFGLQQVQSGISVPLIERRAVNIPPAALLIWQIMLAIGFGILGLFVATPLLAVIVIAVRIMYVEPSEKRFSWDRREVANLGEGAPGDADEVVEPPAVESSSSLTDHFDR